jgi:CheY-like chemotaxis protein
MLAVSFNLKNLEINVLQECVNGLEAVQFVKRYYNDINLDLILLDLDMPIMNGFEACQQIVPEY